MNFQICRRLVAFATAIHFCSASASAFAKTNDNTALPTARLPLYNVITDIPETAWEGLKTAFSKEALPAWAVLLGSTAILYHYDPELYTGAQDLGKRWGLGQEVKYKSVLNLGGTSLFMAPTDTAGWLYFMGDGIVPVGLSIGFIATGYFNSNNRLYNTGVEMFAGLLTGSIFDQAIKHIVGRQSPSAADSPRGSIHPFPNLKAYGQNTAAFDAMPSGHIMTATTMFTVIEQEYPEYNAAMYPIEAVWLTALGFGMMNVSVHWASDYPLGIALGYLFGRTAVLIHHPERNKNLESWNFYPAVDSMNGTYTMNALYKF